MELPILCNQYGIYNCTLMVFDITRQMFITSGGEPEVIHCVRIGHGLGMLTLG